MIKLDSPQDLSPPLHRRTVTDDRFQRVVCRLSRPKPCCFGAAKVMANATSTDNDSMKTPENGALVGLPNHLSFRMYQEHIIALTMRDLAPPKQSS